MSAYLRDIYSILWSDLRSVKRHWIWIILTTLVGPLLYLVAFGYGFGRSVSVEGVSYLAFVIPGIVSLTAMSASYDGACSKLHIDRVYYKSFDEYLLSPINYYSVVIGKAIVGLIRGLISSGALIIIGYFAEPSLVISPIFIGTLVLSCLVFSLFGVLIALVINSHSGMMAVNSLIILPMTFLCGTFFSLSQVPDFLKIVLYALPLTHSSWCLRASALAQSFPWWSLLVLIFFAVALSIGCVFALRKASV